MPFRAIKSRKVWYKCKQGEVKIDTAWPASWFSCLLNFSAKQRKTNIFPNFQAENGSTNYLIFLDEPGTFTLEYNMSQI